MQRIIQEFVMFVGNRAATRYNKYIINTRMTLINIMTTRP